MAAGQKNDSGTFAAFHPRKQCLTEWPVLVLYAKTEENERKMFYVDKKKPPKANNMRCRISCSALYKFFFTSLKLTGSHLLSKSRRLVIYLIKTTLKLTLIKST